MHKTITEEEAASQSFIFPGEPAGLIIKGQCQFCQLLPTLH
jgi:hypothetical protein